MKVDIDETGMLVIISESGAEDLALDTWGDSKRGYAIQRYFQDEYTMGVSEDRKRSNT